jgi:hypothetical protein
VREPDPGFSRLLPRKISMKPTRRQFFSATGRYAAGGFALDREAVYVKTLEGMTTIRPLTGLLRGA